MCTYIYIYVYVYMYVGIYIYIYIDGQTHTRPGLLATPAQFCEITDCGGGNQHMLWKRAASVSLKEVL